MKNVYKVAVLNDKMREFDQWNSFLSILVLVRSCYFVTTFFQDELATLYLT